MTDQANSGRTTGGLVGRLAGKAKEAVGSAVGNEELAREGIAAAVVSLPCWELFEHQSREYKDKVIPPSVKARVAVEQAARFGWQRYASSTNAIIGMKTFGASAPLKELTKKFGFTVEAVVETAKQEIERVK